MHNQSTASVSEYNTEIDSTSASSNCDTITGQAAVSVENIIDWHSPATACESVSCGNTQLAHSVGENANTVSVSNSCNWHSETDTGISVADFARINRAMDAFQKVNDAKQAQRIAKAQSCHNAAAVALVTEYGVSLRTAYRWLKNKNIVGGVRRFGHDGKTYAASYKPGGSQSDVMRHLSIAWHNIGHAHRLANEAGLDDAELAKLSAVAQAAGAMLADWGQA